MGRRSIDQLLPGMVLAEDVLTSGGRFLMPRGTVLDAGHLKSLLAWDLADVLVVETESSTPPGLVPDEVPPVADPAVAAAEAVIRERLCLLDPGQAVVVALSRLAVDHELRKGGVPPVAGGGDSGIGGRHPEEASPQPFASPEALLREEPKLVSPPEVYLRISEVLRNPKSTVEAAAESIKYDPNLTAKLLRLVNSSFYGRTMRAVRGRFPAKVDNLSRAVMVVGARQLATLALGVSVLPLFQDIPPQWVNMRVFWEHSVGCAVAAQAIAAASGHCDPEAAFVAGLLHDIGRIVAFKQAATHMAAAMRQAAANRQPLYLAEREILGFDHAELGGHLLHKWQFPTGLEKMVRYHHNLDEPLIIDEPAVIHLADVLATAMGWGGSGNRYVPPLDTAAWEALGLTAGDLDTLVPLMEDRLAETMRSFFPDRQGPP